MSNLLIESIADLEALIGSLTERLRVQQSSLRVMEAQGLDPQQTRQRLRDLVSDIDRLRKMRLALDIDEPEWYLH